MRVFVVFFVFIFSSYCLSAQQCTLQIGSQPTSQYVFGTVSVDEFSSSYIWFSQEVGNIVPADPQEISSTSFNYNSLYRVTDQAGAAWYFRFSGEWFDAEKTMRTAFYSVQWSNGSFPALPGRYKIESVSAPRQQPGPIRFSTVGDSMTWYGDAQSFRCMLAASLPEYRFIGSRTDSFGYGHDGHGGDNTGEVIARMTIIPVSDIYLLLVGSNDGGFIPSDTAKNIKKIVDGFLLKNSAAHVYVSTLPPRGDQYSAITLQRNDAIRAWYATYTLKSHVTLIDTDEAFRSIPNPIPRFISNDGIHPNYNGYELLTKIVSEAVNTQSAAGMQAAGK